MKTRTGLAVAAFLVALSVLGALVVSGGRTLGLSAAPLATPSPTVSPGGDQQGS